ncbi:hypothetical protein [Nocardiopsis tropica]|uniref:Uncharacterized protein n=1 Tax=Nocardiopsis tropica TaxID=109330 RepID=A0ABU7KQ07_9ACTN|nr:hypothetical protein [Nocardiopsis umidischolae]MEE2051336.1 hypothetical protein [Nocardiopsis umidischolae]
MTSTINSPTASRASLGFGTPDVLPPGAGHVLQPREDLQILGWERTELG